MTSASRTAHMRRRSRPGSVRDQLNAVIRAGLTDWGRNRVPQWPAICRRDVLLCGGGADASGALAAIFGRVGLGRPELVDELLQSRVGG